MPSSLNSGTETVIDRYPQTMPSHYDVGEIKIDNNNNIKE